MIKTWTRKFDAGNVLASAFTYDAADQLVAASVPTAAGTPVNHVYRYDRGGNRTSEQIGSGVTAVTHNALNQATATAATGPVRFAGTVNEPAAVTVNGQPAPVDSQGRFAADVTLAPGTHTIPVAAADGSSNSATKNYEVVVAGGTARTLAYDFNGNLTDNGAGQVYEWDAEDRLTKITQSGNITEFAYNGLGQRVQEKLNGTLVKQWIWCDEAQPAEERDASNAVTRRYYAGLGEQIGANAYFFTTDHLGSVREMTDATGALRARYDYDPYGRITKVSGDLEADFGFTGFHRHQASGLFLTLYRVYDPEIGRWLSRDPMEEGGGVNLYGYVENNPVNAIDPLGLFDLYSHTRGFGHAGVTTYGNQGPTNWDFGRYAGKYPYSIVKGSNILVKYSGSPEAAKHAQFNKVNFRTSQLLEQAIEDHFQQLFDGGVAGTAPTGRVLSANQRYMRSDWSVTNNCTTFSLDQLTTFLDSVAGPLRDEAANLRRRLNGFSGFSPDEVSNKMALYNALMKVSP